MAGLLEKGMAQAPVPGQAQAPVPAAQPAGVQPPRETPVPGQGVAPGQVKDRLKVDEKELDIFISNGVKLVHQEKISDMIISQVVNSANPVESLSNVMLNIVGKLEQSAEESGKQLSFVTMAYGANALLGEILLIADAAGMKALTDEQKVEVLSMTTGKYLDNAIQSGKMTKEELIELGESGAATEQGKEIINFDPKKKYKKSPKKEGV